LVSGSYDGTVKVWNVETGECLKQLLDKSGIIKSLFFTEAGKLVVTSSEGLIKTLDFTILRNQTSSPSSWFLSSLASSVKDFFL